LCQILHHHLGWLCGNIRDVEGSTVDDGTTVVRDRIDRSWISGRRYIAEAITADVHQLAVVDCMAH